jgi:hypothetical protein
MMAMNKNLVVLRKHELRVKCSMNKDPKEETTVAA